MKKNKNQKFPSNDKSPLVMKFRTVFDVLFNVFCVALVILALLFAIASISRTSEKNTIGISKLGNITYAPVASDSMVPIINVGDLAVGHSFNKDEDSLKVGDIITFRQQLNNGEWILNTHKIVRIRYIDENKTQIGHLYTKGENSQFEDPFPVELKNVLSIYKHSYKGLGKPIIWLQSDPMHFFLGVVLPIIILFVIYVVIFIRAIVSAALGKKRLSAATVDGLSEEDKKRLAEEYLAQLAQEKAKEEDKKLDSKTADEDISSSDDK